MDEAILLELAILDLDVGPMVAFELTEHISEPIAVDIRPNHVSIGAKVSVNKLHRFEGSISVGYLDPVISRGNLITNHIGLSITIEIEPSGSCAFLPAEFVEVKS